MRAPNRTLIRVVAPAVLAALVAAACGSSSPSSSSSTSTSGASSGPTYTIAYEGPLSGGNAQLGLNMKFGVQLAINQANAGTTFGKLPFNLKFLAQDDQGSSAQSPAAAQALIGNKGVVAVVGPAFSGATKAAEPAFHEADMATVSPSATAPDLATQGWTNFFRVVADDNAQGPADAIYAAKKLNAKTVYSIDDASAYASGLVGAFDTAAKSDGLTVTHETAPGTTQCQAGTGNVQQYDALATKVKSANPNVVFYAGYYCDFALLAKALRAAGYNGQLLSDDGSNDPKYISQAGSSVAQGTITSCACEDISKVTSSQASSFASEFQKLAGFPAGTYSAEAYDATNTIISVMKGLSAINRGAIVTALKTVNYPGISKTVQFQANGNIAGTAVYVNQVQNGKFTQLGLVSQLVGS
ncbi:MAG TPA: branched-chain amino acid ABC transporter substrate-binding protein [Acidimicrobiales bacterium]|nr:branched-chain amino acid ABC transporter substrate-binding protein [Acidimicrobiales bacterium]